MTTSHRYAGKAAWSIIAKVCACTTVLVSVAKGYAWWTSTSAAFPGLRNPGAYASHSSFLTVQANGRIMPFSPASAKVDGRYRLSVLPNRLDNVSGDR